MEEELLREILQEIQSQSGTNWLDLLLFSIPALAGLTGGLAAAWVGYQAANRSYESQIEAVRLTTKADVEKISFERSLDWRRERYLELQNALAEFIAGLDNMLAAKRRHVASIFRGDQNQAEYLEIANSCRIRAEEIRSSGRLNEGRLKVGDQKIGNLVHTLADEADDRYVDMLRIIKEALEEFNNSGDTPGSANSYWPEEHQIQRDDIAKRTHHISEMIEERVSQAD